MAKQKDIDSIIKNTVLKGGSFAAAPYTIWKETLTTNGKKLLKIHNSNFTNIIFISIWKNYSLEEFKEYIKLSEAYLQLESDEMREKYLIYIFKNIELTSWKEKQASMALGYLQHQCKNLNYKTELVLLENGKELFSTEYKKLSSPDVMPCYAILL